LNEDSINRFLICPKIKQKKKRKHNTTPPLQEKEKKKEKDVNNFLV